METTNEGLISEAANKLGLSQTELARVFQMSGSNGERTIRRWEDEEFPIPGHAMIAIRSLNGQDVKDYIKLADPNYHQIDDTKANPKRTLITCPTLQTTPKQTNRG